MFDIMIIGAGLTGSTLALALKNTSLKIAIIDANSVQQQNVESPAVADLRSIALSYTSMKIFAGLEIWDDLQVVPIRKIHISDRGYFGFTRLDAKQHQVPALGYVVPMQHLTQCLLRKVVQQNNVELIAPAKIQAINCTDDGVTVITDTKNVAAKFLVVADGGQSKTRELLAVAADIYDYQQGAIIANIGLRRDHEFIAYERFTKHGPLAFLPLAKNTSSIVWTHKEQEIDRIMNLNDLEFLTELQQAFGYRLGKFAWVGARQHFPLRLVQSKQPINKQCVLLGNACHTLHPIAGQGFNLTLRDVIVLAEKIVEFQQNLSKKSIEILSENYIRARQQDQQTMINLTDTLVKVFSNSYQPLALLRNIGLLSLDFGLDFGLAKNLLAKKAMGFIYPMMEIAL